MMHIVEQDTSSLLSQAWDQIHTDSVRATAAAQRALDAAGRGSEDAAWAFWLLALAEVQSSNAPAARARLHPARTLFVQHGCRRGQALCAELDAAMALQMGDPMRASLIHRAIDQAADPGFKAIDRFYSRLQRGLFARLLGQWGPALSHFASASEASRASGNEGAMATALAQLGSLQLEMGRLDDALSQGEAALSLARHCGARAAITTAVGSLIVVHDAQGRYEASRELATFALEHPQLQSPGALARLSVPLALSYFRAGDVDRAEAWLEGGSTAYAMEGDNAVFWAWLTVRCVMHRGEHRYARELAERTLLSRKDKAPAFHVVELLHAAADACDAVRRHDAAEAHRQEARRLEESTGLQPRRTVTSTAGFLSDDRHSVPVA
jgi:tetratricopeptide (TPR) repeat protein